MRNGQGYQTNKPFEHKAVVGTLHDDLFGRTSTIIIQYPNHFKLDEDKYALAPSMVTFVATAVGTGLYNGQLIKL